MDSGCECVACRPDTYWVLTIVWNCEVSEADKLERDRLNAPRMSLFEHEGIAGRSHLAHRPLSETAAGPEVMHTDTSRAV